MICSVCNRQVTREDTHTIDIKNGVNYRDYIHNHFILCPTCYSNFKYLLEVSGTPIDGPEDIDNIKNNFSELVKKLVNASTIVPKGESICK